MIAFNDKNKNDLSVESLNEDGDDQGNFGISKNDNDDNDDLGFEKTIETSDNNNNEYQALQSSGNEKSNYNGTNNISIGDNADKKLASSTEGNHLIIKINIIPGIILNTL